MTPIDSSYSTIPLTQGQFAKVSPEDYDWLMQWKWCAHWNRFSKTFYAIRTQRISRTKTRTVMMHREIMGLGFGDRRVVDHIEIGDTLNNTRANLRIATDRQNKYNTTKSSANTSGFKGVVRHRDKWQARMRIDGKRICLGTRNTPEECAELYREAALKHHGEFARLE